VTGPDANGFVEKLQRLWRDPQPETFADLFAPDGTLFHPTMERAIARSEVPDYVQRLKSVADLSLRVRSWAASRDVVLIEWTLRGTLDGERIELEGADRFTLRGDRAIEGVASFDASALWARLDPGNF
jgi:hypothetical protein